MGDDGRWNRLDRWRCRATAADPPKVSLAKVELLPGVGCVVCGQPAPMIANRLQRACVGRCSLAKVAAGAVPRAMRDKLAEMPQEHRQLAVNAMYLQIIGIEDKFLEICDELGLQPDQVLDSGPMEAGSSEE